MLQLMVQSLTHCWLGVHREHCARRAKSLPRLQGQHAATGRLIDNQWKGQRHIRLTAAILEDTESASFHTVTDSFPKIPNLEVSLLVCLPPVHPPVLQDVVCAAPGRQCALILALA